MHIFVFLKAYIMHINPLNNQNFIGVGNEYQLF